MNTDRYNELQLFKSKLTQIEIDEGWHYCLEWDEMLCHPDWEEAKVCGCEITNYIPIKDIK